MKKLLYSAFITFWAMTATLLLLQGLTAPVPADPPRQAPSIDAAPAAAVTPQYGLAEVASHNRLDDCWMAIEGVVYDLTDYVDRHPAPDEVLAAWCGREASEGMKTKDRGRDHSARAWRLLERYRIGTLTETEAGD